MAPSLFSLAHTRLRVSSRTSLRRKWTLTIIPTQAGIIEFDRYHGSQFIDKGNWATRKEGFSRQTALGNATFSNRTRVLVCHGTTLWTSTAMLIQNQSTTSVLRSQRSSSRRSALTFAVFLSPERFVLYFYSLAPCADRVHLGPPSSWPSLAALLLPQPHLTLCFPRLKRLSIRTRMSDASQSQGRT